MLVSLSVCLSLSVCVYMCVRNHISHHNFVKCGPIATTLGMVVAGYDTGVIGSDVPWLECPACNALTWVITVTE